MRRAAAVVAISESLADDARATVPGARRRLRVIRSGAPEWPAHSVPVPGLPESFVVSVASGAPHKRVEDVVAGWAHAVADLGAARVALVLVGDHGAEQQARHAAIAGPLRDSLIHVGRLSDRGELKWIYEHALAMVSMSVLEAFPLTPAEAGSVGCPLILSDIPPHREVAGEHAAFVPPRDVGALAKAMVSATHSPDPGTHRWQWPVSWEDNAAQLMTVFRSVLPPGRSRS
jgi:glycosyltransferase involved in cell wall biosynthesis